jgi:pyridoxal phosphate enzyme (YggS family)
MAVQAVAASDSAIGANLDRVRQRIAAAAEQSGRPASSVRLIGVSKTFPASAVIAACAAGLSDIGENRVQEAAPKAAEVAVAGMRPTWHLIGHLQTNKVKPAVELFGCIHSVDSQHLAAALSKYATTPIDILLEVNVAGEATKTGFTPAEVLEAAPAISALPRLVVRGLMTVAPETDDAEQVRPVFHELRRLSEQLGLPELSMGMSGDYEVAISEGATMVRIGRAIFGSRT